MEMKLLHMKKNTIHIIQVDSNVSVPHEAHTT
jgi:hypothetical protein